MKSGNYVPPDVQKTTFGAVAQQWFDGVDDRRTAKGREPVRFKTKKNYEQTLRLYLNPKLEKRPIGAISTAKLEKVLNTLHTAPHRKGKPVMPSTVRHVYYVLQAVFAFAYRRRLISIDPCFVVDVPGSMPEGRVKVVGSFLSRADVARLDAAMTAEIPVYGLLVRFAAGSGLRASELVGLRLRDLHLNARVPYVHVERTVKTHPLRIEEPKSRRSRRDVPLWDDALVTAMRDHLAHHPRRDDPDAPVFPGRDRAGTINYGQAGADHYLDHTSFLKVYFRRGLEKAGLPFEPHKGTRFHDLRHTCGSQWLGDGHDIYDVSRWLGHSSVSFTERVYIHDPVEPDFSGALARRRALG